jgi:hypothetical protein
MLRLVASGATRERPALQALAVAFWRVGLVAILPNRGGCVLREKSGEFLAVNHPPPPRSDAFQLLLGAPESDGA